MVTANSADQNICKFKECSKHNIWMQKYKIEQNGIVVENLQINKISFTIKINLESIISTFQVDNLNL